MPGREIVQLAKDLVAALLVKVRRLETERVQVGMPVPSSHRFGLVSPWQNCAYYAPRPPSCQAPEPGTQSERPSITPPAQASAQFDISALLAKI